ncbi:hypothetical protein BJ322DRAFT_1097330 [Thelephora terrestris]|uniref:Uncharacterized protein n=1 Tax=Thelephora terrestris TaxID=56493 RepID=A0A9P6LB37_9AGAM|nr:hypothetical protein BJ322DRAFT_1097330 [Thelephora terrestris]
MSGTSNSLPHRSGVSETFNPADNFRGPTRPEHHLHRDSEPLPRTNSTALGQDQSTDPSTSVPRFSHSPSIPHFSSTYRSFLGVTGVHQGTPDFQDSSFKQNAFNSDRPLNVQPADQGGVAIDGRGDLPEGNATTTDKIVGKMQKVTGKYMNKPELHEKGELRESGGKLAVTGEARAPHD